MTGRGSRVPSESATYHRYHTASVFDKQNTYVVFHERFTIVMIVK